MREERMNMGKFQSKNLSSGGEKQNKKTFVNLYRRNNVKSLNSAKYNTYIHKKRKHIFNMLIN